MNAQIKVEINQDILNRKIAQLEKDIGFARKEVVNEATAFFLQSVIKETPPKKVAKDAQDYTHRLLKPAGRESFRVAIYGNKESKMMYGKASGLQKYREIWYRGIGKMGWFGCVKYLQTNTPTKVGKFQAGDKVGLKADTISSVQISENSSGMYMISLTNRVENISRYGAIAASWALAKAHNRLNAWGKPHILKTVRASWRQG